MSDLILKIRKIGKLIAIYNLENGSKILLMGNNMSLLQNMR